MYMYQKVASSFSLQGKDQKELNLWIETLPFRLREGQKELVWYKARKAKTIIWTSKEGFIYKE